jgi:archaea-specific DNA-binding protein
MSEDPLKQSNESSVIFIGAKPVMNYVLAVLTQFNKDVNDVTLKARGRSISRAVDTAEIARNRFMPGLKVKNITIGTESIPSEQGDSVNVSSMEITLTNRI